MRSIYGAVLQDYSRLFDEHFQKFMEKLCVEKCGLKAEQLTKSPVKGLDRILGKAEEYWLEDS